MKKITNALIAVVLVMLTACGPKSLKGTYYCQESTETESGLLGNLLGGCVIEKIEFLDDKTATLVFMGMSVASDYEIKNGLINLDTQQGKMVFQIQDDETLVCKAPVEGTFKK